MTAAEDTNADWLERGARSVIRSRYLSEVVLASGEGAWVVDVEGRRYLDMESGQVAMSLGHSHPRITAVIAEQAAALMQTGSNFTTVEEIELAEALAARTLQPDARAYLCSTGSESNEVAFRIAMKATGRYELVGVVGGYHGLTHGSWSLTSHMPGSRRGYGPPMGGAALVPTPDPALCPKGVSQSEWGEMCAREAERVISLETSGSPAALIFEVVMSAGGVIVPPNSWFQRMREICDERGILMIADEAQTAVGRTGRWFAYEHTGIVPDIVTTSKALGGGAPLAAVIASGPVATAAVENGYTQTATHCGDPFPARVGLANIEAIEEEGLIERANAIGDTIRDYLDAASRDVPIIGSVRGLGSIRGLEIVAPDGSGNAWSEGAEAIFHEARRRGVLLSLRPTKLDRRNVIRLIPPLVISDEDLEHGLSVVTEVARQVWDRAAAGVAADGKPGAAFASG